MSSQERFNKNMCNDNTATQNPVGAATKSTPDNSASSLLSKSLFTLSPSPVKKSGRRDLENGGNHEDSSSSASKSLFSIEDDIDDVGANRDSSNRSDNELEEKITLLEKRLNILQQQCDSNTTNSKRKQKVFVPNEVQYLTRSGYREGGKKEKSWQYGPGMSAFCDVNTDMTDYIKKYVKGLRPTESDAVLNAAVATFFTSRTTVARKDSKFGKEARLKKQARYQRKINKCRMRKRVVNDKEMDMTDQDREIFLQVIKPEWASSESEIEDDDGDLVFQKHPISWRSKRLSKGLHRLDRHAFEKMSQVAQRQYVRRIQGEVVEKPPPKNLATKLLWIKK